MASKELNVKLKHRYDTASNWTTNNPVLLAGEFGIESDTNKMKIGDGSTAWTSLDYTNLTNRIYQDVNIWDLGVGTFIIKPSVNNGNLRIYYDYNNKESFFLVKTGTITISKPNTINTWIRYYFANVLLETVQTTDSIETDISQVLIHGQFGPNQNIYSITKIDGDSPIAKISDLNNKVNRDASNITDINSWETKLGYITSLPSNIAYTDELNRFSKNQYMDGSLIFNRDNPICIEAYVGKTGGDLLAPIGGVFKVNNTDGVVEIGGNEMPIKASGLTDGTTTKSMSEAVNAIGFAEIERQKSKNLLDFLNYTEITAPGQTIEFLNNGVKSTVNSVETSRFMYYALYLTEGTYTLSINCKFTTTVTGHYPVVGLKMDGNTENIIRCNSSYGVDKRYSAEFTVNTAQTVQIALYVSNSFAQIQVGDIAEFTDILLTTDGSTNYQPYYGEIVHKKDLEDVNFSSEHPIGSYHICKTGSEDPALKFGGKWTQIASNVVLPLGNYAPVGTTDSSVALSSVLSGSAISWTGNVSSSYNVLVKTSGKNTYAFTDLTKANKAISGVDVWLRES